MSDHRKDRPMRVCFFFNAQRHQLLHGISTAVELARRPGFEVHVLSPSAEHIAYARWAADQLGGAPLVFSVATGPLLDSLRRTTGAAVPPKVLSLGVLARRLNAFDAICLPERTSILLKRLGVARPRFIHLDHGAGDRAAGFDTRIREFDMVLMAGEKHRRRLAREGLIHPGRHAVVGYPKFDAADAVRDADWRPFADDRPVVLYNPHFCELGSWAAFGEPLLKAFAAQDRYNLIVAPHVRMLDGDAAQARWRALAQAYAGCPHIHLDPGSDRAIDMTHTTLADIYVGDVSSQVYEFLRTPGPCLFLDAHGVDWQADENYGHWRFGPVVREPAAILAAVDRAVERHGQYRTAQVEGFDETFANADTPASARAAGAIADYLAGARAPGRARSAARVAAAALVALGAGWLANDAVGSFTGAAHAQPTFVDEAVSSHRTTLIRAAMHSQPESQELDAAEIERATGIRVALPPATWRLTDVQVYPSDRGPIVQIAAITDAGEPVSLVAMRVETPAERTPLLQTYKGDRVAYWEAGDTAYGVVGDLPGERLLRLASELAPA